MSFRAKLLNSLGLVGVFGAGIAFVWIMGSLPRIDGRIPVKGVEYPIKVQRDTVGIPTIQARTAHDSYFALGWVHAQDRLWQMELQRRVATGRLAEIVGSAGLASDKFIRTLGIEQLAQSSYAVLDQSTRGALEAYAEGINAWLRDHPGRLPPEFLALRHQPEPWQVSDSLAWARILSLRLTNNWQDEILKARLAAILPPKRINELFAPQDELPTTLGANTAQGMIAAIPDSLRPRQASNVWAVSGSRTRSGKPLLANDPHLEFQAPNLWYLTGIEAPGQSLFGATVPGLPFHLIGHNGRLAWGITAGHADSVDLFREQLVDAKSYRGPKGPLPFQIREETIHVKGQDDVTLTVRQTRHGPVISDLIGTELQDDKHVIVMTSTALASGDVNAQAFFKINHALDWRGLQSASRDMVAPVQNLTFADLSGNMGFITMGRVPLRKVGDGSEIRPGWQSEWDWNGFVPLDKMPQSLNPKRGVIINANNPPAPDRKDLKLGWDWPSAYRARRLEQLLTSRQDLTWTDMAAMQQDDMSIPVGELKEIIGPLESDDTQIKLALHLIAQWDGRMGRNMPQPLIWAAWMEELWKHILADELGQAFQQFQPYRPHILADILTRNRHWCDDITTPEAESCSDQSMAALKSALDRLTKTFGPKIQDWRWGQAHSAEFRHPLFSRIGWLNGWGNFSIATDGDNFTVNRGQFTNGAFTHHHGPGLRVVFDLENLGKSRFIMAGGQSGNPLSRHYDDLTQAWRDNQMVTIQGSSPSSDRSQLLLVPSN